MRRRHTRAGAIAGTLGFACIGAAGVPAAASAQTSGTQLNMSLADSRIHVGEPVRVRGRLDRGLAGRTVGLEFRRAGQAAWTRVAGATVRDDGRYALARELPGSGAIRVVLDPPPGAATAASGASSSRERRIAVASRVGVIRRRLDVKAGRSALVSGRLAPSAAGFTVRLQVVRGGRWRTLDSDRTDTAGRFRLADRQRRTRSSRARLLVAPRNGLAAGRRSIGRLNVYRVALASWYGPGFYGQRTGCGERLGHGQLGVAHKTLPCGTKVTLRHRGRRVRVPVIDRGPYAGGREYDLTGATARRLGFQGHGAILVTR